MKYKVGDVVKVREDLELDQIYKFKYGFVLVDKDVIKLKQITILEVFDDYSYSIKELKSYYFTDEMLECLVEPKIEGYTLTEDEKAILRNVDKRYDWIVRDKDDGVYVFTSKPIKEAGYWYSDYDLSIFNHLFQFIKWEDEEPYNIKELLDE